jgi:membrane fusion protein, multidrug efflux system
MKRSSDVRVPRGGSPWRFTIPIALVGLALGLVACGGGEAAEASAQRPAATGGGPGGGPGSMRGGTPGGPTPVEVAAVEVGSIARSVTVSGVIEPIRSVSINSQVSGTLLAVAVEEGDVVRRGRALARVDDRELRAQFDAAEAAHQVAAAAYERARQLRERRVITLPEYERERTAETAARAQRDQVATRLAHTVIESPINGVVTDKRIEAGDLVGSQTRLFTIADISTLVVRVGVSELDVVQIAVGDAVAVSLDAFPGRTFRGSVRRIFPVADPGTRLVPVEVALEGDEAASARPGFLARVTFAVGAHHDVLLVPASALVGAGGTQSVFVLDNGAAVRRTVTTGLTSEGRVEIVAGLTAADRVVTKGSNMLRDGMAVRVVNGAAPGAEG